MIVASKDIRKETLELSQLADIFRQQRAEQGELIGQIGSNTRTFSWETAAGRENNRLLDFNWNIQLVRTYLYCG